MSEPTVIVERGPGGRATVTLNRPEVHNAFDDVLIGRLTEELQALGADGSVRAVVLAGAGKSFSAGADLNWMRRMAEYSEAENIADAEALGRLMTTLATLPKPSIAAVQGAALGGGVGLVAACDIAVAAETAEFALSEVRLGLIPAVISPYVIAAIGARQAGRYFLTGERYDATEARRIGLVHEIVPAAELDAAVDGVVGSLLAGGPMAQAEAKDLVAAVAGRPLDDTLVADTAKRIARVRSSDDAREGLAAFFEKRKPGWRRD